VRRREARRGMSDAARPELSFVLPAFNEAENVAAMTAMLRKAGERTGLSWEILWVDDGSTDGTDRALRALCERDPRVRTVRFSRNFGHMAALTAGMENARAVGAVVTLDADGQHPPAMIPRMVRLWQEGADVVQTVRTATAGEGSLKRITSRGFYAVLNYLSDLDLAEGAADFRLLDRQVVDALVALPERVRFVRGLVQWIGFRRVLLPYKAKARMAGRTKYSLGKMVQLSLNGITSFSIRPLRLSFFLGLAVLALATVYGAYVIVAHAIGVDLVKGWSSLLMSVLVLGGIQLVMLGILSEYLGRIYLEIKNRPLYVERRPRPNDEFGTLDSE